MAFYEHPDKSELKPGLVLFRRGDVDHRMWYCRMKYLKPTAKDGVAEDDDIEVAREASCGASKIGSHFCVHLAVCPPLCDAPKVHRGDIFCPPNGRRRTFGAAIKPRPDQPLYSMLVREAW